MTSSSDPRLIALEKKVSALAEEFDMVTAFRELWKPTVYDSELHARMGNSCATQGFVIIRAALRRETVLALTRMWDSNKRAARMQALPGALNEPGLLESIAQDRANRSGLPAIMPTLLSELTSKRDEANLLIHKYMDGGTHKPFLGSVINVRHERLAHRQIAPATPVPVTFDDGVEEFYADNARIISLLMHLVKATAYNTEEAAAVRERYATLFWASVRGERTEGHPYYQRPPPP